MKSNSQQRARQFLIFAVIGVLVVVTFTQQTERRRETDAFGTAQLTDEEQTYYLVSLYGDIRDDDANGVTITITGVDDPSCPTLDDEITLEITLTIPDIDAIAMNEAITLGDGDALSTEVSMRCLCDLSAGDAEYTLSGEVTFAELTRDFAEGELTLRLTGDVPSTDGTLFAEDTTLDVTIPLFRAPVSVDHCDDY